LNFGYFTLLTSFVIIFVVIRNIPGSLLAPS